MPQERLGNSKPAFFEADTRGRARGSANVRFDPLRALASGGPLRGCLTVTINWPRTYASANMPHKMVTIHNAPAPRAIKPNESGRLPVGFMRFLQLRTPG